MNHWPSKNEHKVLKVLYFSKVAVPLREIASRAKIRPNQVERTILKLNSKGWLNEKRDGYRRYFSLVGDNSDLNLICEYLKKSEFTSNSVVTQAEDIIRAMDKMRFFINGIK